jgi:hypothetical protein
MMTTHRKISLTAGLLYLLTFVSVPTLFLYNAVHSPSYISGLGPDTVTIIAGILEIIVALAGIATAVVLYPLLKKQSERLALGLVAARVLEAATIFLGVAFLLTIVILRQEGVGAEAQLIGHTLATLYDRIFLLGQSFMPAIDDLLLGFLLFQSRLIPRGLAVIGIIGGPILLLGYLAAMFGLVGQHAPIAGLSALPVAVFEFSLGLWLTFRGFNPTAATELEARK